MTPERTDLIRRHWNAYCRDAEGPLKRGDVFRVAIRRPMPSNVPMTGDPTKPQKYEYLEFRLEHGFIDDKPMTRIVCEGLEVEIGPRWPST